MRVLKIINKKLRQAGKISFFPFSPFVLFFVIPLAACNSMFYYPANDKLYNEFIPEKHTVGFVDSASGSKLHYYYFTAENAKALIVYFHGNSRNINASYRNFLWTVSEGYDLIVWDYSGYGQSTGKAKRDVINQDAQSMLEFAIGIKKERGYHLITIGQSLGGAVLLGSLGGFEDRNEIDIILADCTFPSYVKVAKQLMWNHACLPGVFGIGIDDDFAPYKSFGDIKNIPIIVSHCREDKTVPFNLGEELYEKLQSKEKYFVELTCKHSAGYWRKSNQINLLLLFDKIIQKTEIDAPAETKSS